MYDDDKITSHIEVRILYQDMTVKSSFFLKES
jgi:hypothetical protein